MRTYNPQLKYSTLKRNVNGSATTTHIKEIKIK